MYAALDRFIRQQPETLAAICLVLGYAIVLVNGVSAAPWASVVFGAGCVGLLAAPHPGLAPRWRRRLRYALGAMCLASACGIGLVD